MLYTNEQIKCRVIKEKLILLILKRKAIDGERGRKEGVAKRVQEPKFHFEKGKH